ncbi:related to ATP-binding cassette (ABC) transporter [Pseudozyma flocculosa]|uniref:Related to ATP-binding cassette (ABC) transporter n=1 Tax=Pseudozyma flocculosa TaxID=84751 RepID=A0A5C3FCB6_9BASI|nr:related to ATP-binding cassette (ABC) transporter [Pseudozyma flocculosa]
MSGVSQAVIEAGGNVLGVIPAVMVNEKPQGHPASYERQPVSAEGQGPVVLDTSAGPGKMQTVVVNGMHERKARMATESNLGFVALPGGYGTFEEVMEMVTWTQLGIHNKPMVLVNINGFWSPMRQQVDLAHQEGFISDAGRQLIRFVDVEAADVDSCGQRVVDEVLSMQSALAQRPGGYWNWDRSSKTAPDSSPPAPAKRSLPRPDDAPMDVDEVLAVDVPDLTFTFRSDLPPALEHCDLKLRRGSRCLLIGANGAGKSTLLRLLAGKRLCDSKARVFGKDVFRESPSGITYLGTEWAMNPVVRSDIVVSHFLNSVGGYRHKERRDRLLDILDVDLDWHMHAISDGERRRVQLCMGLMEPWDLLLLDEVTVDLDVQVRADLLDFLTQETIERNATIIYATHIFDGLQSFPTHICHMRMGTTVDKEPIVWPPTGADADALPPTDETDQHRDLSPLLSISLAWLRKDKTLRGEAETARGRRRGAQKDADTDSERFFSKYDYSQTVNR